MNYEQYTLKAQEALRSAASIAQKNDHSSIEPEHLLSALLEQEGGVVSSILEQLGVDRGRLERGIADLLKNVPKAYGEAAQVYFSPALQKVLAKSEAEAEAMKDEYVASEHILLALLSVESKVASLLKNLGVTREGVMTVLKSIRGSQTASDENAEENIRSLKSIRETSLRLRAQESSIPSLAGTRKSVA